MTNYVAGHVDDPDVMDSCIGIEFEPENNRAVAYINEEEIGLTYEQVKQLEGDAARVISQMEWHNAAWVYARIPYGTSTAAYHLMRKGEHGKDKRPLCGAQVPEFLPGEHRWDLAPVLGKPWRTGSTCKRCQAIYDKRKEAER